MKNLLIALTLVCGTFAMANEAAKKIEVPSTTEMEKSANAAVAETKVAAKKVDPTKLLTAKKECRAQGLKGAAFTKCIQEKSKAL